MKRFNTIPRQAEHAAIRGARVVVSRSKDRKVEKYASHANSLSPDRGGRPPVAGESFHPHGRKHQVDPQRGCGHLRGVVAPKCVWTISFSLPDPCQLITELT